MSFHRLSVCVSSQVPGWQRCMDELRNPPVIGSGRWTLGSAGRGRQGNWPDTPTSAIHSTFLLNPCPNPTTLPPLPSASPFLIIHCCKPKNISSLLPCPAPLLQSGPGARVTNARPGLALFCRFSFFHCFSQCPVSSAVHVRFPRARGPLLPGGEELWTGRKSGKCVGHKGSST